MHVGTGSLALDIPLSEWVCLLLLQEGSRESKQACHKEEISAMPGKNTRMVLAWGQLQTG